MANPRRAPHRDLLLANHQFPGSYVIKAFGPALGEFREGIHDACIALLSAARVRFSERSSKGGNKICITATCEANDVDEVIALYDRLYEVPGLSLIL